jgi:hypothetical protein
MKNSFILLRRLHGCTRQEGGERKSYEKSSAAREEQEAIARKKTSKKKQLLGKNNRAYLSQNKYLKQGLVVRLVRSKCDD